MKLAPWGMTDRERAVVEAQGLTLGRAVDRVRSLERALEDAVRLTTKIAEATKILQDRVDQLENPTTNPKDKTP